MVSHPGHLPADASAQAAGELLQPPEVRAVFVTEDERLVGVVTRKTLVRESSRRGATRATTGSARSRRRPTTRLGPIAARGRVPVPGGARSGAGPRRRRQAASSESSREASSSGGWPRTRRRTKRRTSRPSSRRRRRRDAVTSPVASSRCMRPAAPGPPLARVARRPRARRRGGCRAPRPRSPEPVRVHDLAQHDEARDDHGRAAGSIPGTRSRSAAVMAASRSSCRRARHAGSDGRAFARGRTPRARGRASRASSPCPRRRSRRAARSEGAASGRTPTRPRARAVGGSQARNRSVTRTHPTSRLVDARRRAFRGEHELCRAAADVDEQRSSSGGRPTPRTIIAASSAPSRSRVANRSSTRSRRGTPRRSRHRARRSSPIASVRRPVRLDLAPVLREPVSDARDREGEESSPPVDTLADARDRQPPGISSRRSPVDVRDEQPGRVRPEVDRCDAGHRPAGRPGASACASRRSRRRGAPRAAPASRVAARAPPGARALECRPRREAARRAQPAPRTASSCRAHPRSLHLAPEPDSAHDAETIAATASASPTRKAARTTRGSYPPRQCMRPGFWIHFVEHRFASRIGVLRHDPAEMWCPLTTLGSEWVLSGHNPYGRSHMRGNGGNGSDAGTGSSVLTPTPTSSTYAVGSCRAHARAPRCGAAVETAPLRAVCRGARRAHRHPGRPEGEGWAEGDLPLRLAGRGRREPRRAHVPGPEPLSRPQRAALVKRMNNALRAPTRSTLPRA